jgi:hypothetical protein
VDAGDQKGWIGGQRERSWGREWKIRDMVLAIVRADECIRWFKETERS